MRVCVSASHAVVGGFASQPSHTKNHYTDQRNHSLDPESIYKQNASENINDFVLNSFL